MRNTKLYDHIATRLSELDMEMIRSVPQGGNWTHIPNSVPSKRLDQIREMAKERGGAVRTTYYGRLHPGRPSYTISTYFNRPGNGCNIHPIQDRTLSIREAARLQSFPDSVRFLGSQSARRKQVGNAVPVFLARAIGGMFPPCKVIDLFAGAGGLSLGLRMAGHEIVAASDVDDTSLEVHASIHPEAKHIVGDINDRKIRDAIKATGKVDLVVGGPPCQGWSYGGWHSRNDPRNSLVWTYIETINELRPRWFVMENVQGLVWMAKGEALASIKKEMSKTYRVTHFVINAADYGCPQLRNRVFIVGALKGEPALPPPPLFSARDMFLPKYISVDEAIGDLPDLAPGDSIDGAEWVPAPDDVSYRKWCRGALTFDEMYRQIRERIDQRLRLPLGIQSKALA